MKIEHGPGGKEVWTLTKFEDGTIGPIDIGFIWSDKSATVRGEVFEVQIESSDVDGDINLWLTVEELDAIILAMQLTKQKWEEHNA